MRQVKAVELIPFPANTDADNFTFDCMTERGTFSFNFRYFSKTWHCWVTLPDGIERQIGVYPNVVSDTGNTNFGFVFKTDMPEIGKSSLFFTELYLLSWD